jgi:hypothetical protein
VTRTLKVAVIGVLLATAMPLAASAQVANPKIVIEEPRYDLGEIYEQDVYKHKFEVKNAGDAELVIKRVKPG